MNMQSCLKSAPLVLALMATASFTGCASHEVNTTRGNIPGYFIRYEMQEADRAVEAARLAGKQQECPAEFKAAEDAKIKAYDVFRACFTEEGAALAKQATAKANALCPPKPVAPPAAPTDSLTIVPDAIITGQTAKLTWTSENAASCEIQPGIGPVPPQGSLTVTPDQATSYTLLCTGPGGSAKSAATIKVSLPAPVPVPAVEVPQPKAVPAKLCSPAVINIKFDTNKSDIKPQYRDELKNLADFLKEFPNATGVIEGHTDSVGSKASNMKLSQRRAESVRNYIIKNFGIAPERLTATGFGPTKPVADNKTKAGKQQNRRIESNFTCNEK